ncbi:MAG: cohesin domain-containing protein, partial [Cytophagales bacterium]|nr:cohesin domain-containing protein [Cytophagales bacterium]
GRSFTFTGTFSQQAKIYCDASKICDRSDIVTALNPCTMTFPGGGSATILANNTYCQSSGLLTLTANPSGGVFTVDGNSGTNIIPLDQVQTHTVSYALNDASGCQYSANNFIIDVVAAPQFTLPSSVEICAGASTNIAVTAQAPYSYSWTVKGTSTPVLSTRSDLTVSPITTTSYTVLATSADGKCSNSKEVQVIVNPVPTLSILGNSLGCTATETCASINLTVTGGTPRFMYYVFDNVNTVPQYAGTSNIFIDCRPGTTYTAHVLDSKGCTSSTTSFTTSRTVDYKIGDVKYICGNPNKRVCIPLIAVTDGSPRVIRGLDFTLAYDPAVLRPVSTTSVGNLGTVVTGLGSATYDINTRKSGKVSVSIYYTAGASPSSKFSGKGTVICLPFDVIGSPALGTKVDITMTNFDDSKNPVTDYQLDEAYKLSEKRRCYEKGSFESIYDNHYRGRLFKPLSNLNNGGGLGKLCSVWNYNNISSTTGLGIPIYYNTIAAGITKVYGKDTSCTSVITGPSTVSRFVSYIDPNYGLFNLPTSTATSVVEISRDIINTPANFIRYVNGFDTYLMSKITDFQIVLGNGASFIPEAHQMIAADVNMNGLVRSNDISHVQLRFIGKINEYPQVWNDLTTLPSKDWRFYQTDDLAKSTFKRSPSYPDENASNKSNFWRDKVPSPAFCLPIKKQCLSDAPDVIFGVLLGDVGAYSFGGCKSNLGITDPNTFNGVYPDFGDANVRTAAREASEELAYLDLTQIEKDGNVFKIPVVVNVPDTVPVFSLDMIIDYNQNNLTVEDVTLTEGTFGKANMAWNNLGSDSLILTSYANEVFPNTGAAYYLHVTSKNNQVLPSDFNAPQVLINGLQAPIGVNTRVISNLQGLSGSSYSGLEIQPVPVVSQSQMVYHVGKVHAQ